MFAITNSLNNSIYSSQLCRCSCLYCPVLGVFANVVYHWYLSQHWYARGWPGFNALARSDAIWCYWSWSTLDQVMYCCLKAPSRYLNQYWLIIKKRSLNIYFSLIFTENILISISLKIEYLKWQSESHFPGANELTALVKDAPGTCQNSEMQCKEFVRQGWNKFLLKFSFSGHSGYGFSQWEVSLRNSLSHWPSPYSNWSCTSYEDSKDWITVEPLIETTKVAKIHKLPHFVGTVSTHYVYLSLVRYHLWFMTSLRGGLLERFHCSVCNKLCWSQHPKQAERISRSRGQAQVQQHWEQVLLWVVCFFSETKCKYVNWLLSARPLELP